MTSDSVILTTTAAFIQRFFSNYLKFHPFRVDDDNGGLHKLSIVVVTLRDERCWVLFTLGQITIILKLTVVYNHVGDSMVSISRLIIPSLEMMVI